MKKVHDVKTSIDFGVGGERELLEALVEKLDCFWDPDSRHLMLYFFTHSLPTYVLQLVKYESKLSLAQFVLVLSNEIQPNNINGIMNIKEK